MSRAYRIGIGVILVISALLFLYPNLRQLWLKQTAGAKLADGDALLAEMEDYNRKLQQDGQTLTDCWSYEQTAILEEDGLEDTDAIGSIQIPAISVELPLYVGATDENMSRGAAVLSQTSMPVGGADTNCVIAAHRGYRGMPYFRRIDELKPGDRVEIRNARECLVYVVERAEIILPTDLRCLEIQPGRDMVTLLSCHPYMGHSQFRYVVYCVREGTEAEDEQKPTEQRETGEKDSSSYEAEASPAIQNDEAVLEQLREAEENIPVVFRLEAVLRKGLGLLFVLVWGLFILDGIRSRKKKNKR